MQQLTDLCSVAEFARRHPDLLPSESSLRWYLRDRAHNGLLKSGAVVEVRRRPDQLRPKLLVNIPRFAGWLMHQRPRVSAA